MKKIFTPLLLAILLAGALAALYAVLDFKRPPRQPLPPIPAPAIPLTEMPREIKITNGVKHSIPLDEIIAGGPPKDGIPSIDKPKFESVDAADKYLKDDLLGIGIVDGDTKRFYPFQILVWHEIVNDVVNDAPFVITYCPLCGTALVFDRRVDGQTYEFGVSGKLYQSDLLMYDRTTDSLWSQILGEAVVGELTGKKLTLYPFFENLTWGDWKKKHPDSQVLSRDTGALRDYTYDPYGGYGSSPQVWFPVTRRDERLFAKDWITGVVVNGAAKAYPNKLMDKLGVVNDVVADKPLLIVKDPEDGVKIFERGDLRFIVSPDGTLKDQSTDTTWDYSGNALQGPLKGQQLKRVPPVLSFWFAWAAFFPNTQLLEDNN